MIPNEVLAPTSKTFEERLKNQFSDIQKKNSFYENESNLQTASRNVAQYGARIAETIAGLPGNFKQAFQQSAEFFSPEAFQSAKKAEEKAFGSPEKGSFEDIIINPPGSKQIRENITPIVAEKAFGEKSFLEPKGPIEKATGELVEDFINFFLPGTNRFRLAVRLGAPIIGNLAKEGVRYAGGDEETAQKVKTGFMLATTLAGQSNPLQYSNQRIADAKNMVPQGMTVFSQPLNQNLTQLQNRLNSGLRVPSKSKTRQGIRDLERQTDPQGRIPMRSLMDARDNINEWIAEAGGWDVPGPVRDASIRNLNTLKRNIIDTIDTNLQRRLPQAADLYQTGYQASAVTHRSNAISSFIEKNFGKKAASVGLKLLFPAALGGATVLPKTAAIAAASVPFYKTGQVLYRVANSPTLAAYYADVLAHSTAGNVPAMIHSLNKLDKELLKEEKKEKNVSLEDFKASFKNKD